MLSSNYFQVNKTRDSRTTTDQSEDIFEPDQDKKMKKLNPGPTQVANSP